MRVFISIFLMLTMIASPLLGVDPLPYENWDSESQKAFDFWKEGDQKEAEKYLGNIKTKNAQTLFLHALLLRSRYAIEKTNDLFQSIIKKYPESWEALVSKEILNVDTLNSPEESYLRLQELSLRYPDDLLLHLTMGFWTNEFTKNSNTKIGLKPLEITQIAIYHYRKLLEHFSNCPAPIAQNYANLLSSVGLHEEELEYRKIASEKERRAWSLSSLADTYAILGENEKAESLYRDCIRNYEDKSRSYFQLCTFLLQQNRDEEAYKCAKEYVQWRSIDPYAWLQFANCAFRLKKNEEAIVGFKKYLEQNKGDKWILIRYAYLLDQNERWDEALEVSKSYENSKNKIFSKNALFQQIEQGDLTGISIYLKNGGDVNITDPGVSSQTLLMKAIQYGKTEIALKILELKPNLNAIDANKCTALMYAAENGRNFLFEKLLDLGADPWLKTKWGELAGDLAISNQNYDVMKILLKKYPVVLYKSNYNSMLFYAAGWGYADFVKLFLDEGVPFNEVCVIPKNKRRQTALMNACEYAHAEVIRLLVEIGANLKAVDQQGKTALHYLAGSKPFPNLELYQWLIAKGAEETVVDLSGKTPLTIKLSSEAKRHLLKSSDSVK